MEKKFRISSKSILCTYPQVPEAWSHESVKASLEGIWIKKAWSNKHFIIAQEEHKDGGIHYHVAMSFHKKVDIKNANDLDIMGRHGNYQGIKEWPNTVRYCTKDKKYITNISPLELELLLDPDLSLKQITNKILLRKALDFGPEKLLEDGDCSLMQFEFVVRGFNTYKKIKVVDEREDLDTRLETRWGFELKVNLENKQCHFWIWSHEPNKGKTTFLTSIRKKYRAEFWNYGEVFQDSIKTSTEIILFDEMRGSRLKATTLNQICDGTFGFPQKGAACIYLVTGKPLVIVCSNLEISECYKDPISDLIKARFIEIKL